MAVISVMREGQDLETVEFEQGGSWRWLSRAGATLRGISPTNARVLVFPTVLVGLRGSGGTWAGMSAGWIQWRGERGDVSISVLFQICFSRRITHELDVFAVPIKPVYSRDVVKGDDGCIISFRRAGCV